MDNLNFIKIGLVQIQNIYNKFNDNNSLHKKSWRRELLVYSWIYTQNEYPKDNMGKTTKTEIYKQIEHDINEPKPHIVVGKLIKAGFVKWDTIPLNGRTLYYLKCTTAKKTTEPKLVNEGKIKERPTPKRRSTKKQDLTITDLKANPDLLLTTGQVQQILGVSNPTLYRWRESHIVPCYKVGGVYKYRADQILKFLDENQL